MKKDKIFRILGVEETKDEELLKAAYRKKLVITNPEDNAEKFKELRCAYEEALKLARDTRDGNIPKDEYDLWLDKIRDAYFDIKKRIDENVWRDLLSDKLCKEIDTEEKAKNILLDFLAENCHVPHKIWIVIDEKLELISNANQLSDRYSESFLKYIENQIKNEDFIDYDLFSGPEKGEYEELIEIIFELEKEYMEIMYEETYDFDKMKKLIIETQEMSVSHPFVDMYKMIVAKTEDRMDEAQDICEELMNGFAEHTGKDYIDNYLIKYYISSVLECVGQTNQAHEMRKEILELYPKHRLALIDTITYHYNNGEYEKSKRMCIDYLESFGNHEKIEQYMKMSNDRIIEEYIEKAEQGDVKSIFELGWCYFQNDKIDECIELIKGMNPERGDKNEYEYVNLLGRCYAVSDKYDEAYPYLSRWRELVYEEDPDDEQANEKRKKRRGYANYLLAVCMCSKAITVADTTKNEKAEREFFYKAADYINKAIKDEVNIREKILYKERLSYVYLKLEEYEKCIGATTQLIEDFPAFYNAYIFRQKANYALGNYAKVMEDYYNAINYYDKDSQAYIMAAKVYYQIRNLDNLRNVLDTAKENGVNSDELLLFNLKYEWNNSEKDGDVEEYILEQLGKLEKKCIEDEQETDIEDLSGILIFKATVYLSIGMETEGFSCLRKALEINTCKVDIVNLIMANYYSEMEEYEKELIALEKVKMVRPDDIEMEFRIGVCHLFLGHNQRAKEYFDKVYEKMPDHYAINTYFSDYYMRLYEETEDVNYYDKSLEFSKMQCAIDNRLNFVLKKGRIYWERYHMAEAIEAFEYVLEQDPEYQDARYYLAKAYRARGEKSDYAKALEILAQASEMKVLPRHIDERLIHEEFVNLLIIVNQYSQALEIIEKIKDIYGSQEWIMELESDIETYQGLYDVEISKNHFMLETLSEQDNVDEELVIKYARKAARANWNIGDTENAMNYFEIAIEYSRDDKCELTDIYLEIATNYYENDYDCENAIKYANMALECAIGKQKVYAYIDLAKFHADLGDKEKAKEYFQKYRMSCEEYYGSIEAYVSFPHLRRARLFGLGVYYRAMGDYDALKSILEQMRDSYMCIICKYRKCYELLLVEAFLFELEGNKDAALEKYNYALEMAVNSRYIKQLILKLER